MKKATIVEIYGHHVYVETLARILLNLGIEVTVACTAPIRSNLRQYFKKDGSDISLILPSKGENDFHFLRRLRATVDNNGTDIVFLNTVQGWAIVKLFFFRPNVVTVVTNGRLSEWFGRNYKLTGHDNIRDLVYYNYSHFFLQRILRRINNMIFHTPQAIDYARENGYKGNIAKLPFSLYSTPEYVEQNKTFHIVVTGSIEEKSRDYIGLLDAILNLDENLHSRFRLVLLTKQKQHSYGIKVKKSITELLKIGIDVKFYDDWVPEEEFFKQTKKSDILISPIKYETYYACGELTSAIVDAVRQGKPGIYPEGYLPDYRIQSSSLFYNHIDDVKNIIENLIVNPGRLSQLKKNAIINAEHYSLNSTSKELAYFLEGVRDSRSES